MSDRDPREAAPTAGDQAHRLIDPRAVRVAPAVPAPDDPPPLVLGPPARPLVPDTHLGGHGVLGGIADPQRRPADPGDAAADPRQPVLADGEPRRLALHRLGNGRVVVEERDGDEVIRFPAVILPAPAAPDAGVARREVLVDGWSIQVEIESERRAALRERARRSTDAAHGGGPTEVRAIIPGRIVSVSVAPGDEVVAGQQLLVVEAMKMQNELRAPRDGTIEAVAVAPGDTIEVRDLLLVLS